MLTEKPQATKAVQTAQPNSDIKVELKCRQDAGVSVILNTNSGADNSFSSCERNYGSQQIFQGISEIATSQLLDHLQKFNLRPENSEGHFLVFTHLLEMMWKARKLIAIKQKHPAAQKFCFRRSFVKQVNMALTGFQNKLEPAEIFATEDGDISSGDEEKVFTPVSGERYIERTLQSIKNFLFNKTPHITQNLSSQVIQLKAPSESVEDSAVFTLKFQKKETFDRFLEMLTQKDPCDTKAVESLLNEIRTGTDIKLTTPLGGNARSFLKNITTLFFQVMHSKKEGQDMTEEQRIDGVADIARAIAHFSPAERGSAWLSECMATILTRKVTGDEEINFIFGYEKEDSANALDFQACSLSPENFRAWFRERVRYMRRQSKIKVELESDQDSKVGVTLKINSGTDISKTLAPGLRRNIMKMFCRDLEGPERKQRGALARFIEKQRGSSRRKAVDYEGIYGSQQVFRSMSKEAVSKGLTKLDEPLENLKQAFDFWWDLLKTAMGERQKIAGVQKDRNSGRFEFRQSVNKRGSKIQAEAEIHSASDGSECSNDSCTVNTNIAMLQYIKRGFDSLRNLFSDKERNVRTDMSKLLMSLSASPKSNQDNLLFDQGSVFQLTFKNKEIFDRAGEVIKKEDIHEEDIDNILNEIKKEKTDIILRSPFGFRSRSFLVKTARLFFKVMQPQESVSETDRINNIADIVRSIASFTPARRGSAWLSEYMATLLIRKVTGDDKVNFIFGHDEEHATKRALDFQAFSLSPENFRAWFQERVRYMRGLSSDAASLLTKRDHVEAEDEMSNPAKRPRLSGASSTVPTP